MLYLYYIISSDLHEFFIHKIGKVKPGRKIKQKQYVWNENVPLNKNRNDSFLPQIKPFFFLFTVVVAFRMYMSWTSQITILNFFPLHSSNICMFVIFFRESYLIQLAKQQLHEERLALKRKGMPLFLLLLLFTNLFRILFSLLQMMLLLLVYCIVTECSFFCKCCTWVCTVLSVCLAATGGKMFHYLSSCSQGLSGCCHKSVVCNQDIYRLLSFL